MVRNSNHRPREAFPMSKRKADADIDFPVKRINRNVFPTEETTPPLISSHIALLSDEIMLHIFEMLDLPQILSCQSVSHRWHQVSTDPELWKRLYFLRFILPRLAHVQSRTRTRIACQEWWNTERTQADEGRPRKDWKHMFKVRHNWHKGRCAISEIDISELSSPHTAIENTPMYLPDRVWRLLRMPDVPAPLVQFDGTIFIAVDKDSDLRAWNIVEFEDGKRKQVAQREFGVWEDGWQLGKPSALAIDGRDATTDVAVGFESGAAMILQLVQEQKSDEGNFGFLKRYLLAPEQVPHKIAHITYSHPYLLTLDVDYRFRAYYFESDEQTLSQPRLLAALQAQALNGPCNLSIRKPRNEGTGPVIASIAYAMPVLNAGWSVGIQEIILDISSPDGIKQTRIGTCFPRAFELAAHFGLDPTQMRAPNVPVTRPSSISYSHPYLLTSHRDNTLTLYLARSTETAITIGQPRRLWGHTSGVARADVAGRGRAVSVSQQGSEVRVWELEPLAAAILRAGDAGSGATVGIVDSVRLENTRLVSKVGSELFLQIGEPPSMEPTAVEWIGFDEEKVLVMTSRIERDNAVTLYDFNC